MSDFMYNSVVLPYPRCLDFRQDAVFEESNTDRILTRIDVTVQSTINANYMSFVCPDLVVGGAPTTDQAAEIMNVIRSRLLKPRKALSYTFASRQLIPQRAGVNGDVDAKNGPQPQSCTILELNNVTFLVTYRVVAHYWENIGVNAQLNPATVNRAGNPVLYNRWSETVDIDSTDFSRVIREGTYAIRSDNDRGLIADRFRETMAQLGVPSGCLREASSYSVTPDGLAIRYRVVDKEVFKLPPQPAFEADGEYTESASRSFAKRFGDVRVRLRGAKTTSQAILLNTAVAVCASKLNINGPSAVMEGGSLTVDMYNNLVEVRMRAQFKSNKERFKDWSGLRFGNSIVETPGTDDDRPPKPQYQLRGTLSWLLQAAAYFDPSLRNTVLVPKLGQLSAGREVGQAGLNLE